MHLSRRHHRTAAFSIVELVVVLAIIAALIGLLLPAIQKIRENSARVKCLNNLRQLGLAVQTYHEQNNLLPPYFGENQMGKRGMFGGWFGHLMPFVEETGPYENIIDDIQKS